MKVGFTSTSLRRYSVDEVVETALSSGAYAIEWGSDYHVRNVGEAKSAGVLCRENGIAVNAYGTYYHIGTGSDDEWKKICEIAAVLGTGNIRTWLGTKGSRITTEREYSLLVEKTVKMADTAEEYGLVISNECHPNTYNDTTESSLRYLKDVGRDNVKTYYQSWYRDRKNDMEKLEKLYPYLTDVHISFSELKKFQMFHRKDPEFISLILNRLKKLKFDGCVLIEFTSGNKPDNLIKDIEKARKLI